MLNPANAMYAYMALVYCKHTIIYIRCTAISTQHSINFCFEHLYLGTTLLCSLILAVYPIFEEENKHKCHQGNYCNKDCSIDD